MPLIVQSNTSNSVVTNADSYVTLSELREYLVNRGHSNWETLIPLDVTNGVSPIVTGEFTLGVTNTAIALTYDSAVFDADNLPRVGATIRITGFTGIGPFFATVKMSTSTRLEITPLDLSLTVANNQTTDNVTVQVNVSNAENLARRATDWIDRRFDFIGEKTTLTQRLKWPREYASYPDDQYRYYPDTEIPLLVKEAVCIVAEVYRDTTKDIDGVVNFTNVVKKKKIDVIEIEYDSMIQQKYGASSATILNPVYELLRPLTFSRKGLMRS